MTSPFDTATEEAMDRARKATVTLRAIRLQMQDEKRLPPMCRRPYSDWTRASREEGDDDGK